MFLIPTQLQRHIVWTQFFLLVELFVDAFPLDLASLAELASSDILRQTSSHVVF